MRVGWIKLLFLMKKHSTVNRPALPRNRQEWPTWLVRDLALPDTESGSTHFYARKETEGCDVAPEVKPKAPSGGVRHGVHSVLVSLQDHKSRRQRPNSCPELGARLKLRNYRALEGKEQQNSENSIEQGEPDETASKAQEDHCHESSSDHAHNAGKSLRKRVDETG